MATHGATVGAYLPSFGATVSRADALVAAQYETAGATVFGKPLEFVGPGPNALIAQISLP